MVKQWLAWGAGALVIGMALARCGSSSKSSPSNPAPAPSPTTGTTQLPASFTGSGICSSCHGTDGSMNPPVGGDTGHVVKGTTLTAAAFLGFVRSGEKNGAMPPCSTTCMSDADVTQTYNYATGH